MQDTASEAFYRAAIGSKSQNYYRAYFRRADASAGSQPSTSRGDSKPSLVLSWNWAAFFGSFTWLLYRKMWGWAALYVSVPVIAESLTDFASARGAPEILGLAMSSIDFVALFFVFPAVANAIYRTQVRKWIAATVRPAGRAGPSKPILTEPTSLQLIQISARGGTSATMATLGSVAATTFCLPLPLIVFGPSWKR